VIPLTRERRATFQQLKRYTGTAMKDKDPQPGADRPDPTPKPRLPYERPAVISDEVFETMALSCQRTVIGCGGARS
jgi:hypothetical protein